MHIHAVALLCQLLAHVFVEACYDNLTVFVATVVVALVGRDGRTLDGAYAKDVDLYALVACLLHGFVHAGFMVLTVGDKDYSLANIILRCEALQCQADCIADGCALTAYHRWRYGFKKHLCRYVVGCDGQLREGITGKDDEPHLVVLHAVDELRHKTLGLLQPVGLDVLRQHGV